MNKSYVFLADGFEEIEALGTVDILRRAGMTVETVGLNEDGIETGAHGVPVKADITLKDVDSDLAEWLILPGGMPGAQNLRDSERVCDLLRKHNAKGGRIAAICAAPAVVLGQLGLLEGKEAVCYPGFESQCTGAKMKEDRCVVSGNIVTANGPSSMTNFAYTIVCEAKGKRTADKVMNDMLLYPEEQPYYF